MKDRPKIAAPFIQALPGILQYQLLTNVVIGLWLFLMGKVFRFLLHSAGRVAISTGDFTFLFTNWQGILIILTMIVSLFVYLALDLNAKIILSNDLLTGDPVRVWSILKRALPTITKFINIRGLIVILYVALIAPLLGFGLSLSVTERLYIPTFIASVIADTPLYLAAVTLLCLLFISIGIANLFILHGVVLDGLSLKEAGKQSGKLIRANWKDYLIQNVLFILIMAFFLLAVLVLFLVLPLILVEFLPLSEELRRILTVFFTASGLFLSYVANLFVNPLYLMKMTQLYHCYKQDEQIAFHMWKQRKHGLTILGIAVWLIVSLALSFVMVRSFDTLFPLESSVQIIAHRGGGTEGPENTVAGIEKAWEAGAYGSEIDIQRTKDGHYVINHDNNFKRVAGDKRKPSQMTLEEVKKLSVGGEPVPTLEEALLAAKGRGVLFIELKGDTADRQMADDAVKIVRELGMEQESVMISLKYDLIDYLERTYPEIETGYLTFASFGDTALLNCDYLALEEESATAGTISDIHDQGKKVLVWTANEKDSQKEFLCSKVDGIITDQVKQAADIAEEMKERTDLERIVDTIVALIK